MILRASPSDGEQQARRSASASVGDGHEPLVGTPTLDDHQTTAFLRVVHDAGPGGYLDVRARFACGAMDRVFVPLHRLRQASEIARCQGTHADVFVGVLRRAVPRGDRGAVTGGAVLWSDCDDRAALERMHDFQPAPSLIVRSGSPDHAHAYWLLDRWLPAPMLERANARLAHALGADERATDAPRVLRLPGTLNHKHDPPSAVTLEHCSDVRYAPAEVVGALSDPVRPERVASATARQASTDSLLAIPAAVYAQALAGVATGRSRKVRCPFHDDQQPSLHLYEDPARGWYCFGCRRGGSIYDFAGELWGMPRRGASFLRLRERIEHELPALAAEARRRERR